MLVDRLADSLAQAAPPHNYLKALLILPDSCCAKFRTGASGATE